MSIIDVTPPGICDPIPVPTFPVLPSGITFAVGLPPVVGPPLGLRLCCKMVQLQPGIAFPPFSLPLNSALIASINVVIKQINNYMHAIPVLCPRE